MKRLLTLSIALLILSGSVEAKKRPRHRRAHTTQAQPEPVLTPCARFRLANPGVPQKLTPEQERRIKLGIDAPRPANVDPCP